MSSEDNHNNEYEHQSGYVPYVPPPPPKQDKVINSIYFYKPLNWLVRAWNDIDNAQIPTAVFGLVFWAMSMMLMAVFKWLPEYTVSFISGCILIGPFLAMGLYDAARRSSLGIPQNIVESLLCWRPHIGSMSLLVLVLIVLELLWGRASLVAFAVFFTSKASNAAGALQLLLNPDNWQFLLVYSLICFVFAGLVFACCVISLPMILDRDTDAISAGFTSIKVVALNPLTLIMWAGCIFAIMALALLMPLGIGLIIAVPLIGYASWHAYRDAIEWKVELEQSCV